MNPFTVKRLIFCFLFFEIQINLIGAEIIKIKRIPYTGNDLTILISTKDITGNPSQPIILDVTVENQSNIEYRYTESLFSIDYKYSISRIENEKVEDVTMTKLGEQLIKNLGSFRTVPRVLPPAHKIVNQIIMNRLFDMSLPGNYRIRVTRAFVNPWKKNEILSISSNELEITLHNDNFFTLGNDSIRNATGELIPPPNFPLSPDLKSKIFLNDDNK